MKFLLKTFIVAGAMWITSAVQTDAQTNNAQCYERWNLLYVLANERGERLDQMRQVDGTGFLEAYKSTAGGTWTIVFSNDHAVSCILASGVGLRDSDVSTTRPVVEYSI